MSAKGCCYDNAVTESFFHSLKVECLYDYRFKSREKAQQTVFEYIEIYYNKIRMHSAIDYKSPEQYKALEKQAS